MFLVSDTIERRHRFIDGFLDSEQAVAGLLLAAADFERTVRRAILGLGCNPTKHIRDNVLSRKNLKGFNGYKTAWKEEVKRRLGINLAYGAVQNWSEVKKAFSLRNKVIHGDTIKVSQEYGSEMTRHILAASCDLHALAQRNGVNLDATIRRYKTRT